MKLLILSATPKTEGLCVSVLKELTEGAREGGADVSVVRLQDHEIGRCRVCDDGWGICRETHRCTYGDDGYDAVTAEVAGADTVILLTPVYWGEMAEQMKCYLDRFRRCHFGADGALSGKQVLIVATPGGSGNGLLSCLEQMDRFCRHTGAQIFDTIGVNRWNADYKRIAARAAARAVASGRKNGDTVDAR